MLSISTKKAGALIVCPSCTEEVRVPGEVDPTAALNTVDSRSPQPAAATPPAASAPSRPTGGAYSAGAAGKHKPLFDDADHSDHSHDDEEHDEDEEEHTGHKKKRFMDDTIDMTAMVDVTFLLLIFFMVTASFAAQKVFETSPPEQESDGAGGAPASSVEDLESSSVIVEIDAADQLRVDDQPISGMYELREALAAKLAESKTEVLIQAEYAATHGMVVAVTDAAMDAGMQKVRRVSRNADD